MKMRSCFVDYLGEIVNRTPLWISSGSRLFLRRGANSQSALLFCKFFAENCMKMNTFGVGGGETPLGSANAIQRRLCLYFRQDNIPVGCIPLTYLCHWILWIKWKHLGKTHMELKISNRHCHEQNVRDPRWKRGAFLDTRVRRLVMIGASLNT